jgi:HAD superfamily hydrolase (TIGR01549 family)
MGRLMDEDFRPYRDELFISTKAGYDMWPGPYGNWGSRKYLMASLDQSLRRMKIDYVDLFYSHRYDPETPLEETLQALREEGYTLSIVSNCQRGYVEAFLRGSGLGAYFADYEEWERTCRPKGENIRLVMERNGFERAVYVGDTGKDEEAARVAGIPFIHAAYGFGKAEAPEGVIGSLEELPVLIRRMIPGS